MTDIPILDKHGLRQFGLITGAIFGALFGVLFPWLGDAGFVLWPWIIVAILWVLALIVPSALNPIYKGWMRVGHVVGWINTRILMALIFYFILLPVGIGLRIFGKDPMNRKIEKDRESYRTPSHSLPKERMEKPF